MIPPAMLFARAAPLASRHLLYLVGAGRFLVLDHTRLRGNAALAPSPFQQIPGLEGHFL